MDQLTKDLIQILAWAVAMGAGIITAYRALHELKLNRQQRALELKWKKAKLAKEVIAEYEAKEQFGIAHLLLAWNAREYQLPDGQRTTIDFDTVMQALRVENRTFSSKEKYIRDALILYFDAISRLEHFIQRDLIDFEDVRYIFVYAVGRIAPQKAVIQSFLGMYHKDNLAAGFLKRFPEWSASKSS